jgi:hypothetical protein
MYFWSCEMFLTIEWWATIPRLIYIWRVWLIYPELVNAPGRIRTCDPRILSLTGHVRQGSEHENGLEKPKSASDNLVFDMLDDFQDEERLQTLTKGLHQLFEEHPEYRKRSPGQIACRLHMGRYTPFVPTDEEVEAAIKEAP